jgi:hypothetical protein
MIVTQLFGGLGNQMFQYALGRALAEKHRSALLLDTSWFAKSSFDVHSVRSYALDRYRIQAEVLTDSDRSTLRLPSLDDGRIRRWCHRIFGRPTMPLVRERQFEFDAVVLESPDPCYLSGYWQSPKYFEPIGPVLRQEFTLRMALAGENLDIAALISRGRAVSLHVRRGDYVTNPQTNKTHPPCGPEYYATAVALLRQKLGDFHLYAFSDDPDWVERNLKFRVPMTVVRHNNSVEPHADLHLLTQCNHHIISNSSFSWWGAWLSPQAGKIVVAPRRWFRDPALNTDDLIPAEWIRL